MGNGGAAPGGAAGAPLACCRMLSDWRLSVARPIGSASDSSSSSPKLEWRLGMIDMRTKKCEMCPSCWLLGRRPGLRGCGRCWQLHAGDFRRYSSDPTRRGRRTGYCLASPSFCAPTNGRQRGAHTAARARVWRCLDACASGGDTSLSRSVRDASCHFFSTH